MLWLYTLNTNFVISKAIHAYLRIRVHISEIIYRGEQKEEIL